ncbi:MAG: hypothetical protein WBS19_04445 [Candidatus Korobacteraceae bacterium]
MRVVVWTGLYCMIFCLTAYCSVTGYSYTGNRFTSIYGPSPVTTSDFVSGSFTLYDPLKPNLPFGTDISRHVISIEFSDGINTYIAGQDGMSLAFSSIGTNADGVITTWLFELSSSTGAIRIFTANPPPDYALHADLTANDYQGWWARNDFSPGFWNLTTVLAAEPNSLALLATGLLAIAGTLRRKVGG